MVSRFKDFLLLESTKQLKNIIQKWWGNKDERYFITIDDLYNELDTKYGNDNNAYMIAAKYFIDNGSMPIQKELDKILKIMKKKKQSYQDIIKIGFDDYLIDNADVDIKEEYINPDDIETLEFIYENKEYDIKVYKILNGDAIYDLRKIINNHRGKNANPWCLLQGDNDGNLKKEAFEFWDDYDFYIKAVAFRKSKIYAFYASDYEPVWWDLQDKPHFGIIIDDRLEIDPLFDFDVYDSFDIDMYHYIDMRYEYYSYTLKQKDGVAYFYKEIIEWELDEDEAEDDGSFSFTISNNNGEEFHFDKEGDYYRVNIAKVTESVIDLLVDKYLDYFDNLHIKKLILYGELYNDYNPTYNYEDLFRYVDDIILEDIYEPRMVINLENPKNILLKNCKNLQRIYLPVNSGHNFKIEISDKTNINTIVINTLDMTYLNNMLTYLLDNDKLFIKYLYLSSEKMISKDNLLKIKNKNINIFETNEDNV